jgi:hypothetical protein
MTSDWVAVSYGNRSATAEPTFALLMWPGGQVSCGLLCCARQVVTHPCCVCFLAALCRGYTRKEPFANLFGGLPWTPTVENWNGRWEPPGGHDSLHLPDSTIKLLLG